MRRTFKALAAITAGVALLLLSAAPSGAQTGTVTGGTIVVNLTPTLTETLGNGTSTDPNCNSTLGVTFTNSLTSGHVTITLRTPFVYSSGNYILELTYSSSTMTITGTSPYTVAIAAFVITDVNVYNATGLDSCTRSSTTPKCSNIDVNFASGLTGTFTGTITHNATTSVHTLSGTFHLGGVGNIAAVGCTPPFSALNGKTATISSMTVAV